MTGARRPFGGFWSGAGLLVLFALPFVLFAMWCGWPLGVRLDGPRVRR